MIPTGLINLRRCAEDEDGVEARLSSPRGRGRPKSDLAAKMPKEASGTHILLCMQGTYHPQKHTTAFQRHLASTFAATAHV